MQLDPIMSPAQMSEGTSEEAQSYIIDTSDLILTDSERVEIEAFEQRLRIIKANSLQRKAERAKGPFRFLDLPAELRNMTYGFVFANEDAYTEGFDFARHSTPNITRVSQQLRAESLPLFFAECDFRLPIGTNIHDRARYRAGMPFWPWASATVILRSGVLHVKKPVKHAIRLAAQSAIFRHVTLQVCDARDWTFRGPLPDQRLLAAICLRIRNGNLEVHVREGEDHPRVKPFQPMNVEAACVDDALAEPLRIARSIGLRKGFKGFGLRDLEQIVKPFRFVPPS